MFGLYIHIPFCVKKCPYCDFNSYTGKLHLAQDYVNSLLKEAKKHAGLPVDTIFIGGGTPTCLPSGLLPSLLDRISNLFHIAPNAEITVEANPGTLNPALLSDLHHSGANRLSIGVQSLNPDLLTTLGRIHTAEDFYNSVQMAKTAGFTNISADMMFALPTQTLQDWTTDIKTISQMGLTHISCYSLKIEEGTPFYDMKIKPASDELDRDMYHTAIDILAKAGYKRYEISNFAQNGKESRHNLKYWLCQPYIGLGAGAHSCKDNIRYSNTKSVEDYINAINHGSSPQIEQTTLTPSDILSEKIFLGLRLDQGVPLSLINQFENSNEIIKKLTAQNLIRQSGNKITLTQKGIDLSNQVFMEFI